MTGARIAAIVLIFVLVSIGWAILAAAMFQRTQQSEASLRPKVEGLWGSPQSQLAPQAHAEWTETVRVWSEKDKQMVERRQPRQKELALASSAVNVDLRVDFRRKGLLWYRTYEVTFDGAYSVTNEADRERMLVVGFQFPSPTAIYDDFTFSVAGQETPAVAGAQQTLQASVLARPRQTVPIKLHYRSRTERAISARSPLASPRKRRSPRRSAA